MPAADAELEAKIVPDESAIEEVEERELELGGGGELTSSQENKRQGIISGGFRSALVATGVLGLLASLKPVTATISAILGIIGRSVVPVLEVIADILRPVNEAINDVVQTISNEGGREITGTALAAGQSLSGVAGFSGFGVLGGLQDLVGGEDGTQSATNPSSSEAITTLAKALSQVSTSQGNGSPDQSDEASKIDQRNEAEQAGTDILGLYQ